MALRPRRSFLPFWRATWSGWRFCVVQWEARIPCESCWLLSGIWIGSCTFPSWSSWSLCEGRDRLGFCSQAWLARFLRIGSIGRDCCFWWTFRVLGIAWDCFWDWLFLAVNAWLTLQVAAPCASLSLVSWLFWARWPVWVRFMSYAGWCFWRQGQRCLWVSELVRFASFLRLSQRHRWFSSSVPASWTFISLYWQTIDQRLLISSQQQCPSYHLIDTSTFPHLLFPLGLLIL